MYPKLYADYFRRFDRAAEVFVAMPFQSSFEARWRDIFKPAVTSLGLRAIRVNERRVSDDIPVEILDGIARAKFVLVDASSVSVGGKLGPPNANVMYELGLAHAWRLPEEVVILRDSSNPEGTPFDIRHVRWIPFNPTKATASVRLIRRLFQAAERDIDLTRDRLVERAMTRLDLDLFAFLETVQSEESFDLYPFDPDRKGLYALGHRDSSEQELRSLARRLITLGLLEPGGPGPREHRVYGAVSVYVVTPFGRAVVKKLQRERWSDQSKGKPPRRLTPRCTRRPPALAASGRG